MIFDLDDTLIETSKCLTPIVLARAFDKMQEEGLGLKKDAVEDLFAFNKKALTSEEALKKFFTQYPEKKEFLSVGVFSLSFPIPDSINLLAVPYACEVLNELQVKHTLALVTRGEKNFQLQKMKKAGIQPGQFSKLIINRGLSKKSDYLSLLDEFGCAPSDVCVCGDRVPFDLSPGRELGFRTVHFRNGRGLNHIEPREDVDVTIYCLTKLNEVLGHNES